MAEKKFKIRKDGTPKVPLSIFEKIVIIFSVLLVVATILSGTMKYGFNKLEGLSSVITSSLFDDEKDKKKIDKKWLVLANRLMPEQIEIETNDGVRFNVKLEVNVDFNNTETEAITDYLNVITVYDSNGKPVGNDEKFENYDITGLQAKGKAVFKVLEQLADLKEKNNNAFIIIILLDIVAAVFIAYIIWKRADDRRELREAKLRESEIKKITGISEDEARQPKKKKKKKK